MGLDVDRECKMFYKFIILLLILVRPQALPMTKDFIDKPVLKAGLPIPPQAGLITQTPTSTTGLADQAVLKFKPPSQMEVKNAQINEFPLQEIFLRGKFANEANKFIKGNIYHGKLLETQYENVREEDLNYLEEKLKKKYKEESNTSIRTKVMSS